jgi:hypothetical protein
MGCNKNCDRAMVTCRFQRTSSKPPPQKLSQLWALLLTLPKPIVLRTDHGAEVVVADEATGQERLRILERAEEILERRSSSTLNLHRHD